MRVVRDAGQAALTDAASADGQSGCRPLVSGMLTRYVVSVKVVPGARKHGVLDDDMRHAVRHAIRTVDLQDEDKTLMIGVDRAGRLLEVVVVGLDTDQSRIIHAMRLRRSFYRFFEGR